MKINMCGAETSESAAQVNGVDPEPEHGPSIIIGGRRYWTRKELAKALKKSPQTLAGWAINGRLCGPKFIKCGKTPLYPHENVVEWLNGGPGGWN
jgi:hypothetical protein